jgi:hypothetical protein
MWSICLILNWSFCLVLNWSNFLVLNWGICLVPYRNFNPCKLDMPNNKVSIWERIYITLHERTLIVLGFGVVQLIQWIGYRLDGLGIESRQGKGILLASESSRMALGPTQHPLQWVPGFFRGRLSPRCHNDQPHPRGAEFQNEYSCTSNSPV